MLTLLATNQLMVVADFTDRFFAWTISVRPNSAFLGAAYAAGFVLSVLALRRHRWRDVRVALLTVTVFTVLTLVPTLLHLHRLHLMERRCRPPRGMVLVGHLHRHSDRLPDRGDQAAAVSREGIAVRRPCPPGSPGCSPPKASRCSGWAPCSSSAAHRAPPAAGRHELLALAAHPLERPGDRGLAARAGRGGRVGDLGTRPHPDARAGGDLHGVRRVPTAGGAPVLDQISPDYQWPWAYVALLVSIPRPARTAVGGHPRLGGSGRSRAPV